jgi:hypothetical protein
VGSLVERGAGCEYLDYQCLGEGKFPALVSQFQPLSPMSQRLALWSKRIDQGLFHGATPVAKVHWYDLNALELVH